MDEKIYTCTARELDNMIDFDKARALSALEQGRVVYFPAYCFDLSAREETDFLTPHLLNKRHKNISFNYLTSQLSGHCHATLPNASPHPLAHFMQNYAHFAKYLITTLFPTYGSHLLWGRTSYRPAEIKNRPSSKLKDDTQLHVDSFAASPVNGLRILRVFCNINPHKLPRTWDLGEPFIKVANYFNQHLPPYRATLASLLHLFKGTKTKRSAYDHYQLKLHNAMKLDHNYQQRAQKTRVDFAARSTWIVFSDSVSHAAHNGQFLLEQTFYLPVEAMNSPELSPLYYWQHTKGI